MIDRLIELALRFRVAVIGATLVLIAAGSWAFANINFDAFPDLTPNQVQVITVAPGMSPNEVENLVSYPMETAMMGLPRTQGVRSISKAGISVVTISYDDDVDLYFARAQVTQRMQDAAGALPSGMQPTLGPPATPMGEVFQYLVQSDSLSLMDLKTLQEYTIKPLLRTIPGVADVNSWGGQVQQFHVLADPSKLSGYGISLRELEGALAANNGNFGAGYIENRGERFTVRGIGRLGDVRDIGNVVVSTRAGGIPVYVRDVAQVEIGAMPREGAVSRDGRGETLSGLCGLGDLVLTCSSTSSRNFSLGKALGEGMSAAEALSGKNSVAEGAATAPVLADLARRNGIDMPIVEAVCRLLAGEAPAGHVVADLLARPLRAEQGDPS